MKLLWRSKKNLNCRMRIQSAKYKKTLKKEKFNHSKVNSLRNKKKSSILRMMNLKPLKKLKKSQKKRKSMRRLSTLNFPN